jgi:hypothetical protein
MDIGNLKTAAPSSKWYLLNGDEVEEGKIGTRLAFHIRALRPGEIRKAQKEGVKTLFTGRRRVRMENEDSGEQKMLDAAVLGWKNLDEGGKPMEVTLENKVWLDDNVTEFATLWRQAGVSSGELGEEEEGN